MKTLKKIFYKSQIANFTSSNPSKFFSERNIEENILLSKNGDYTKISIIMPSYNQAEFIERAILSVLNQNYPNMEFIIIDGGSTDGTIEIIKKYEKYIDYWVSEKDNGQSDALNKGIKESTGEILGWMNSDDTYLPNALNKVAKAFQNNKKPSVIFGNTITIDEEDNLMDITYSFPFSFGQLINEGFVSVTQSFFWTSSIHSKIKGFDNNLFTNMDLDFYIQLRTVYNIKKWVYINEFLGCFRKHKNQKTSNKYWEIIKKDLIYIENKHSIQIMKNLLLKYLYKIKRYYYYISLPRTKFGKIDNN